MDFSETMESIVRDAKADCRFFSDMEIVRRVAREDATTCSARGTADVLTEKKSHAYITKITSRSARQTLVFTDGPDSEARHIASAVARYLRERKVPLLWLDRQMGLHPRHSTLCRTVMTKKYARLLFMWDKLLFKPSAKKVDDGPEQVLINVPEWEEVAQEYIPEWCTRQKREGRPLRRILVDAKAGITFVLGTDYFGEVKKGHLRMAMYRQKLRYGESNCREGGLGVHAGGKVIRTRTADGNLRDSGALFFGLSGTGKTTLSMHHFWLKKGGERVIVRQDDFFVLDKDAKAYGTEENAYIKTEGLDEEGQPLLYRGAMSESAVLENVYVDPESRKVDFFRYDHPFTPNGKCLNGRGVVVRGELEENGVKQADNDVDLESVDLVFFITRRDTVVPPVAKLSERQAAAFFVLGESILTSAADPVRAGQSVREVGTNPFIVGSGGEEGNMFHDICSSNRNMQCFLLNTGGFGGRTVELGNGTLAQGEFAESVERFSKGIMHPKVGDELSLGDRGKRTSYKVTLVKVEAEHNGETVKDPKALGELLAEARKGEVNPSEVRVYEHAHLMAEKIGIRDSCTIIREIARGSVEWGEDEYWGYRVPKKIPGIDLNRFDWRRYYSEKEYTGMNEELKAERKEWLSRFPDLQKGILSAFG